MAMPITWVSLATWERLTPEQRNNPNIAIDLTLPDPRQQRRFWQREIETEAAAQGVTTTDIVRGR